LVKKVSGGLTLSRKIVDLVIGGFVDSQFGVV